MCVQKISVPVTFARVNSRVTVDVPVCVIRLSELSNLLAHNLVGGPTHT